MRSYIALLFLLSACGGSAPEAGNSVTAEVPVPSGPPIIQQAEGEVPDTALPGAPRWESATGDGGTGLRLVNESGTLQMSIACPEARTRLIVSVPSFKPVGSEDRFSLALGEEPVTLVADPMRQKQGVTGEGVVPETFGKLLEKAERIGALYGNQRSGPHPAPPESLLKALAKECGA